MSVNIDLTEYSPEKSSSFLGTAWNRFLPRNMAAVNAVVNAVFLPFFMGKSQSNQHDFLLKRKRLLKCISIT